MDVELKTALDGISDTVKGFKTRIDEVSNETKQIQRQVDAMNIELLKPHRAGQFESKSIAEEVLESAEIKHLAETGRGRAAVMIPDFQTKTAITNTALGAYTTGVVMPERLPGIVPAAMRTFRVRELLRVVPTTAGYIDFVKVTSYPKASPQVEASAKYEGAMTFDSVSERVKTLAVWIPASRQALQDASALREAIDTHLMGGLHDEEDVQLLSGDGTGENFNGMLTQATEFDTSLLVASDGWERADVLARAIQQIESANQRATGIVLNPADWWSIVLTKDTTGRYIHGDPSAMTETRLWGRPVSVTTAMLAGRFLVGDFVTGAAFHLRMDGVIEVSDSHSDYFTKNLVAIRCEERGCLAVYKTASLVTGSLTQSPA